MIRALALSLTLFGLWLALSGMFSGLLISLGAVSTLLVVGIAQRMDVVDHEGYPLHLSPLRVVRYALWLVLEVVKSNIDVARHIWSRKLAISPVVVRVESTQKSKIGQVIFANSITLTPGTVSINLSANEIRVHALTRESAEALQQGSMDARVTQLEGD